MRAFACILILLLLAACPHQARGQYKSRHQVFGADSLQVVGDSSLYQRKKALSLGTATGGLGFGNFFRYEGVLLGFFDMHQAFMNGLSISVFQNTHQQKGVSLGLIFNGDKAQSGLSVGFLNFSSRSFIQGEYRRGLALAYWLQTEHLIGAGIAPFLVAAERMEGTAIAPVTILNGGRGVVLAIYSEIKRGDAVGFPEPDPKLGWRGVCISPFFLYGKGVMKGLTVSALNILPFAQMKGLVLGGVNVSGGKHLVEIGAINAAYKARKVRQIGLVNDGRSLSGTQIGLVNLSRVGEDCDTVRQIGLLNFEIYQKTSGKRGLHFRPFYAQFTHLPFDWDRLRPRRRGRDYRREPPDAHERRFRRD